MTKSEQFKDANVEYHLVNFHDEIWQNMSIQFNETVCKQIVDVLKRNHEARFSDISHSICNEVKSAVQGRTIS